MRTQKLLVLLLFVGTVSCKKDKPLHPSGDCNDLPGTNLQPAFSVESPVYGMPCFNPNNADEFVYLFLDYGQGIGQLRKHNIQTGENTLVVNSSSRRPIKWGRGGRIAFAVAGHIYTVKDNGEELTQFTTTNQNNFPSWNDTGDELVWDYSIIAGQSYAVLMQKLNQPVPDTIFYGSIMESDRIGNRLLCRRTFNINETPYVGYYDLSAPFPLTASNFISIAKLGGGVDGLCGADNGETIYTTIYADGLYKTDVSTGKITQLFDFCPSIRYEGISCSPDGRFLLGERVDSRVENGYVVEKHSIYLIDLQTMKETKMNL